MQNEVLRRIQDNVAKVMIGKEEVTKLLQASLAAGGHVLLEDVPGTGKTVLAKTEIYGLSVRQSAVYAGSFTYRCDRTVIF